MIAGLESRYAASSRAQAHRTKRSSVRMVTRPQAEHELSLELWHAAWKRATRPRRQRAGGRGQLPISRRDSPASRRRQAREREGRQ